LKALEPPEGGEAEIDQLAEDLSKGAALMEKEGGRALQSSELSRFESKARAYGLKACPRLY
jgi:hypothetical protein